MDGQVEGKACGLVAMSTDVDISLLHKCFELGPYDCLVLKYQVGPGYGTTSALPAAASPCHVARGSNAV